MATIEQRIRSVRMRSSVNLDYYAKIKPHKNQKSLFDEEDHPRNQSGEFAKKDEKNAHSSIDDSVQKDKISVVADSKFLERESDKMKEKLPVSETEVKSSESSEFHGENGAKASMSDAYKEPGGDFRLGGVSWTAPSTASEGVRGKKFARGTVMRTDAEGRNQRWDSEKGELMVDFGIHTIGVKKTNIKVRVSDKPELKRAIDKGIEGLARLKKQESDALDAIKRGDTPIEPSLREGEYLTGYSVGGDVAELLEKLKAASYVSGWGYKVSDDVINTLGKKFTYPQVEEMFKPRMAKEERVKNAAEEHHRSVAEKRQKMIAAGDRMATEKQLAVIRRAKRDWFDLFDGAAGYGMDGPTESELQTMTIGEASKLVGMIVKPY